ncbi:MAG TPA: type II toxin-antitoxin system Phd/YefM family antitoxin [Candidatus Acidoferrum sp.]|jgi:prevent-host-death family protein|nr:type II toxin-antitoxin system Phd/YefM family antitoxin [Candidatus Acidoferrum sp.]
MALTKKERDTQVVPALRARTQLGQILKRVRETKKRFIIVKRGDPQAVIMSLEEYLKLGEEPAFLKRIHRAAKENGLDRLSMRDIDREIKTARKELRLKKK